jgi:hypothetical protein
VNFLNKNPASLVAVITKSWVLSKRNDYLASGDELCVDFDWYGESSTI